MKEDRTRLYSILTGLSVKKLWQVIPDQGVQPSLPIILAPGVQAQHKLSFQEFFNEMLHRTQADPGSLTAVGYRTHSLRPGNFKDERQSN